MPVYNFKTIATVPSAKDFIDIILSKTQRKTPTVIHKGYKINRIRNFYMRKVKYTCQNYHDKLTEILEEFPRLDDIHPFYRDLINVLYSRSHYKLALGQINTARTLIDNLGKDFVRLLKFGDSLYRCKELKRAALGRMCTLLKKLNSSLGYLEQVRQHLSRLPSIDPSSRTLLITGYPNVGKSSFINKLSRAEVEVQPYAFTTKSLFVGHTDYKYMRWQVIDTPGILDHPLEDRNTIEMQAITALAHLHSTVLYFVDISESCGYSIKQQVSLFHNIKPLFSNKPLLIVANKIDLKKIEDLDPADRKLIEDMAKDRNTAIIPMSNQTEEGINQVKNTACNMLLEHRVERKMKTKCVDEVVNRIQITRPQPRDEKERGTSIPQSVVEERERQRQGQPREKKKTLKQIERENGGAGVFSFHLQNHWDLENNEWQFDIVPEILDGHNIADFVDEDVEQRLAELEAEEDEQQRQAEEAGVMDGDDDEELDDEQMELVEHIREKQKLIKQAGIINKTNNKPVVPRTAKRRDMDDVEDKLREVGLDAGKLRERAQTRGRKRTRDEAGVGGPNSSMEAAMDDVDGDSNMAGGSRSDSKGRNKSKSKSRPRARSLSGTRGDVNTVVPGEGFRTVKQKKDALKLRKSGQKEMVMRGRQGESDRRYGNPKPKHLFSGKRGMGKTDRR